MVKSEKVKMERPNIKEMYLEEKWDRLHDFFTMDHAISYKTQKRLGTVNEWVDDTVEAYRNLGPRFIGPVAKIVGEIAPNKALKEGIDRVLYSDQMMHNPSEYEVSMPSDGEIIIRF
jgi:isoleucyl-tRNA synthetase